MFKPLPPPPPFKYPTIHCPSCGHGIDPHGLDPGGKCNVGMMTEDGHYWPCECLWSPNDIAANLLELWDKLDEQSQ
jgi:hypothetical protein